MRIRTRHLLSLSDLSKDELLGLIRLGRRLKRLHRAGRAYTPLKGRILALIFHKPSTRTRLSFEAGILQLGGHAIHLNASELQLGRGETVADTARVLSRFVDAVMVRTYSHEELAELSRNASVPVINGLTDFLHPCQVLADLLTVSELRPIDPSLHVCYIGDANNVANTWLEAAVLLGFRMSFVVPPRYSFGPDIFRHLRLDPDRLPKNIRIDHDPASGLVADADFLYTDVWVSMGQDGEKEERLAALRPYQVNDDLLRRCKPSVKVMHCLPAHRGEEITSSVMDGPASVVFEQAENRLHAQKALLVSLLKR